MIRVSEKDSRVGSEKMFVKSFAALAYFSSDRGPEGVSFLRGGEVFLESLFYVVHNKSPRERQQARMREG